MLAVFVARRAWKDSVALLLVAGFLANWLPFVGIERVMFLHSYFAAFLFSLLALGWCIQGSGLARRYYGWLLVPAFGGFLAAAHLTYGLPVLLPFIRL